VYPYTSAELSNLRNQLLARHPHQVLVHCFQAFQVRRSRIQPVGIVAQNASPRSTAEELALSDYPDLRDVLRLRYS
jgi:hypothetical protein